MAYLLNLACMISLWALVSAEEAEKNVEIKIGVELEDAILSLNYPSAARSGTKQNWRLTTTPGYSIQLICDDIRIANMEGCTYGYLEIDDGIKPRKYCGSEPGLTIISENNIMTVKLDLPRSNGLVKCGATGVVKMEGIPDRNDDGEINIPLGTPAYGKMFFNYLPASTDKKWSFSTDNNAKLSLICDEIGFQLGSKCEDHEFSVDGEKICHQKEEPFMKMSSGNTMLVELRAERRLSGKLSCLVQAINGTKPNYYMNFESYEIDSTEYGGPPGSKKTSCDCGWSNKNESARVVNGDKVDYPKFPWMAALLKDNLQFCGGSIISEYNILTAAHCTRDKAPEDIVVRIGSHNWAKEGVTHRVTFIREHFYSRWNMHANDIAVLMLEEKITYTDTIGPVCLAPVIPKLDNKYITVMGWGELGDEAEGVYPDILMQAHMRVVDYVTCDFYYLRSFNDTSPNKICTWASDRDSCFGDSGGPLVWLDPETNRYSQVGLVSFGKGCNTDFPKVNTLVPHYYPWIQDVIAMYTPNARTCRKIG